QLFHLRIRVNSRGGQKLFELLETLRQHLLLQLGEPLYRAGLLQVRITELADFLGKQRDGVRTKLARAGRLRRTQEHQRESNCRKSAKHLCAPHAPHSFPISDDSSVRRSSHGAFCSAARAVPPLSPESTPRTPRR